MDDIMYSAPILSADIIIKYAVGAVSVIIAVTLFEYIKAAVSTMLGDRLPRQNGALTLNPIKHFEPIGFLLFLFTGYGWGKPAQTSNMYYNKDFGRDSYTNRKICVFITYIMPMLVSLLISLALRVFIISGFVTNKYILLFLHSLNTNFASLFVFNLIPVYPMCGSRLLKCVLTPNAAMQFGQYEKIIQVVIIFMLLTGILKMPLDAAVSVFSGQLWLG